jgi:hypothetical protein
MKKSEFLKHWIDLPADQKIAPAVVPYKHKGTTFDEDGIRITGSLKFIDSVLSRLKDLLNYENGETRLQVLYQETKDKKTGQPTGSHSCYVQVHERGDEAKMANAFASALAKKPVIISKGY